MTSLPNAKDQHRSTQTARATHQAKQALSVKMTSGEIGALPVVIILTLPPNNART